MSTRNGFQSIFIPIVIPPTNSNVAIVFNNLTTIPRGVYIVSFSYSIDPIAVGGNVANIYWTMNQIGLGGTLPPVSILELHDSAASRPDINANGSMTNIVNIPNDNTQIYLSISAATSGGQFQTPTVGSDANYTKVSFVRIA